MSGNNSYTGGTKVAAGTLRAGNQNAFGPSGSQITVQPGGTFDPAGYDFSGEGSDYAVSVGGAGVNGNGAIVSSAGGVLGNVTLTSDASFGGTTSWAAGDDVGYPGYAGASIMGNGYSLTKVGANTVTFCGFWLNGAGNVTGVKNININAGTLAAVESVTIDNSQPGSIGINAGEHSTLQVSSTEAQT